MLTLLHYSGNPWGRGPNLLFRYLLLAFLLAGAGACVDLEFDEPPIPGLPNIVANATIADLKALHTAGEPDRLIETELIIRGVVAADDKSGNFLRSLFILDQTGGLELRLNSVGLYNAYPIGRELFVRCKGLYIGEKDGIFRLNGNPDEPLEVVLFDKYLVPGAFNQPLDIDTVSVAKLEDRNLGTLVHLRNMQFAVADTAQSFADAAGRLPLTRTLQDCFGNSIPLRSGGYAEFATTATPSGNGGITGIYIQQGNTRQLIIRDLSDISFSGARCGVPAGGGGGGSNNVVVISLRELRNLFASGSRSIPANRKIRATAISDRANGNYEPRYLYLQDSSGGIAAVFQTDHAFSLHEQIEIDVSGLNLAEVRGLLQIEGLSSDRAKSLGAVVPPLPRQATIAELLNQWENLESTLIQLKNVTVSGGSNGVWKGTVTASDGTGSLVIYTRDLASFAPQALPNRAVNLVGIASQLNTPLVLLRNPTDLSPGDDGGSGGNGPVTELYEPFTSQANDQNIDLSGWINLVVKGTQSWQAKAFGGNTYAQASAFNDPNSEMETWLITPPLQLDSRRLLSFRSSLTFYKHDGLSVWISKDFNGNNFDDATWTKINARIAGENDGQSTWVNSGDIDLQEFTGKVYIGFRYVGTGAVNTTTYRIDDVRIRKP